MSKLAVLEATGSVVLTTMDETLAAQDGPAETEAEGSSDHQEAAPQDPATTADNDKVDQQQQEEDRMAFLEADTSHMTNSRKSLVDDDVDDDVKNPPAKTNSYPSTLTDSNDDHHRDLPVESDHCGGFEHDNHDNDDEDDVSLSLSIPSRFKVVQVPSSLPSSLNSSFVTYYDDHTIDDIRNMVLVDDDTHGTRSREVSLSPPRPCRGGVTTARKQQLQPWPPHLFKTPVTRNTSSESQPQPNNNNNTNTKSTPPPMPLEDALAQHNNNAQHERADSCPVRPMRGMSIGSASTLDSEHIKAVLLQQQQQQQQQQYNNQSSNTFPSMWEDSWTTFATLDNMSHHGPASVIMEEIEENPTSTTTDPQQLLLQFNRRSTPPPPPPMDPQPHPYSPQALQKQQQQQQQQQQQMKIPKRSSSVQSTLSQNKKKPPRRTSSRNSQYSAFSNMSSLDASVIRRISRSERINRLKRKSMQQQLLHQQISAFATVTSSLVPNTSKHSSASAASTDAGYNSLSSNSKLPERRPTKILPPDEEAEQEPKSFWGHSSSQLSLTSSSSDDDEDDDDDDKTAATAGNAPDDGADMTPRLPGRRHSASSMSLYEAEAAAIRLQEAHDLPLMAPLRRTSTFGSQTEFYLSHARGEDLIDDAGDNGNKNKRRGRKRPPVSSIHVPPQPEQSTTEPTAEDQVPKAPARQRSLPRPAAEPPKWLQYAKAAAAAKNSSDLLFDPDNSSQQPLSVLTTTSSSSDCIPSRPRRQTTLTKENLPKGMALRGDHDSNTENNSSGGEEKENTSLQASNSSLSISSQQGGGGHRRTNSADAAPNQPTRATSKSPRPPSPAVLMLAQSTSLGDSKELLLLSDGEQKSLERLLRNRESTKKKDGNKNDPLQHQEQPICETSSSSFSASALPQKPPTLDDRGRIGSVTSISTGATTECANNTRIATMGRRMPPGRHYTQGSSLRSAAASLKNRRFSDGSVNPGQDDLVAEAAAEEAAPPEESKARASTDAPIMSSDTPMMSPSSEFEQLKLLNEDTMRDLSEHLMECMNVD
ncbi:expressed unknown protein (Partial), partial [Seminavis robusta]|eukprot:Sro2605_g332400.1 n/a (1041) ;mRNA; r:2-3124